VLLGGQILGRSPLGAIRAFDFVEDEYIPGGEIACVHWEDRSWEIACEPRVAIVKEECRVYSVGCDDNTGGTFNRKRKC
jgi:hypothetical protein